MKIFLLPLLGMCVALCSEATNISNGQAMEIAQQFFNKNIRKAPGSQANAVVRQVAATPSCFAFNRGEGAGYVIVSSNDAAIHPVLGYNDDGEFDPNNIPPATQWLLDGLDKEMSNARPSSNIKPTPHMALATIEPLIKAPMGSRLTHKAGENTGMSELPAGFYVIKSTSGNARTIYIKR